MVSVDRDGLVIWISVQRGLFPAQIAMSLNEAATLMAQIESALSASGTTSRLRAAALNKPPRRGNCYPQTLLANHNKRGSRLSHNA